MYCPIQDIQRNSDGNVNDDDDIDMDDVKFDNVGESNNVENIKMLIYLSS